MDEKVLRRTILVLVSTILKLSKRLAGDDWHPSDEEKLARFNKLAKHMFSETESIEFYLARGMTVFDSEIANEIIKSPRQLTKEQLFRTELDGDNEQANLIESAHKKLGR